MITDFALIICTYNRKYFIKKCLSRIMQNFFLPKKIIIVDQNYDDVTINFAKYIFKKYNYKNFIIIKNIKKRGLTVSKNIALNYINEKFIFFIDDDISINKNFFKNITNSMTLTNAHGISGAISNQNKSLFNIFFHYFFNFGPLRDNRYYYQKFKKLKKKIFLQKVSQIPGGITCFSRKIFKKIKFDEKYITHHYEDVDFCLRLNKIYPSLNFYIDFRSTGIDEIHQNHKKNLSKRIKAMYLLFLKHKSLYFFSIVLLSFVGLSISNFIFSFKKLLFKKY